MAQAGINETELLSRLRLGDANAYSLLYDRYWESLYIQAYKRVNDEEASKDIVQNVLINIWQRHETLHISSELEHYLNAAVKFQVFSYFRTEKVKDKVMDQALLRFEDISTINDLEGYYELERLIAGEIELLPDKMKEAYLLKAEKHSISEIALRLNLKEQTVSNHLSEALRRIRIKLGSKYPEWVVSAILVMLNTFHN
ncbi:MAG TPA: sigma-70 family RNA polymerase sigma factor [Pedobacter sp.]